jgi:hypothetical protein
MSTAIATLHATDQVCASHQVLPFSDIDRAAVERAQVTLRGRLVRVTQSTDYPSVPNVAEISWPGSDQVRWLVWRDADGVWLDELDTQNLTGPGTAADAFNAAIAVLEAEYRAATANLPRGFSRA